MAKLLAAFLLVTFLTPSLVWCQDVVISTQAKASASVVIAQKIITEAYRRIGRTVTYAYLPLERSLQEANDGRVDGELYRQDGISLEFPQLIKVPVVLLAGNMMAFSKTRRFVVAGWKSLLPYTVAYLRGQKSVQEFLVPGQRAHALGTLEQAFQMLEADRVDLVIATETTGQGLIRTLNLADITALAPPLQSVAVYHYVNRKNAALVPALTAALQAMDSEGLLARYRSQTLNSSE